MKRKTSTAPTKIYTYGCRLPSEGADLVDAQLRLSRVYYNKLLEIELARRVKVRAAMAEVPDVAQAQDLVDDLTKQIEGLRTVINAAKGAARSGAVDVQVQRGKIKELQGSRRAAILVLKAAKEACKTPEMLARFATISAEANAEVKSARAVCGLYWGSYLLVENAIEAARKSSTDPQFRRWDGCGRVGVQLQGGLAVSKVFGNDARLRIDPLPTTGSNRGRMMTTARIRVGSDEKGHPVWAAFPFRMHRPLPADGTIKWAWIHRTFKGRWVNWDLQISVEAPSFARDERPPHDGGVVAIDIGWRQRPSNANGSDLRVAFWRDDQGNKGELLLPAEIKQKLEHAESLRSIQDRSFDEAKTALLGWLGEQDRLLSPRLKEALAHIAQSKSAKRLGAAVDTWKTERMEGDEGIFTRLTAWWKQHRHLYDWEVCERDRALNRRKDIYRNMAAQLTRKYAAVVVEDLDKRKLARRQAPESEKKDLPQSTRHNRVVSAPSVFTQSLKSAAPGNGCKVYKVDPRLTTKTCSFCGFTEEWDASKLHHTCPKCGRTWDQDDNASVNILERYFDSKMSVQETKVLQQRAQRTAPEA